MGIEPTKPLFRGFAGFEARRSVAATDDSDTTCDDRSPVVGRMVGQPAAALTPLSPSLDDIREMVSACDDLPEYIRSAMLALLQTVSRDEPNTD